MNENLAKSSFPFDKINFAAVPELAREAVEKASIEDGEIYRMTFHRGFAITETGMGSLGSAYWKIEIRGTRENVTATADPQGKMLGVDLTGTSQAADYKLTTTAELQKAQDALENFFGAKAQFSEMLIDEKRLGFRVINPQNPSVQDTYQYNINGLTKSGLVQMPVAKLPDQANVSINDIEMTDAVELIEKAKKRVDMPDAVMSGISLRRNKSSSNKGFRMIWGVSLKKGASEGNVYYDNDGNETLVRKNGKIIFSEK